MEFLYEGMTVVLWGGGRVTPWKEELCCFPKEAKYGGCSLWQVLGKGRSQGREFYGGA